MLVDVLELLPHVMLLLLFCILKRLEIQWVTLFKNSTPPGGWGGLSEVSRFRDESVAAGSWLEWLFSPRFLWFDPVSWLWLCILTCMLVTCWSCGCCIIGVVCEQRGIIAEERLVHSTVSFRQSACGQCAPGDRDTFGPVVLCWGS